MPHHLLVSSLLRTASLVHCCLPCSRVTSPSLALLCLKLSPALLFPTVKPHHSNCYPQCSAPEYSSLSLKKVSKFFSQSVCCTRWRLELECRESRQWGGLGQGGCVRLSHIYCGRCCFWFCSHFLSKGLPLSLDVFGQYFPQGIALSGLNTEPLDSPSCDVWKHLVFTLLPSQWELANGWKYSQIHCQGGILPGLLDT